MVDGRAVAGGVLAIAATFFASLGDNTVKYSYNLLKRKGLKREGRWKCLWSSENVLPNTLFLCGWFSTAVFAVVLNALAFRLAPASLVVPTSACHILWNAYFSACINREVLSVHILGDTLLLLLGVTGVFIGSPKATPPLSIRGIVCCLSCWAAQDDENWADAETLVGLYFRTPFLCYSAMMGIVLMTMFYFAFFQTAQAWASRLSAMALPGLFASYTCCFGKTAVEMTETTNGKGAGDGGYIYVMVLLIILCGLTQVAYPC